MGPDLLAAVDDPAVHEVAQGPGLGGGEGRRPPVVPRGRVARRAAAAPPAVVVVAVQVGPDETGPGRRLAVLAPEPVRVAGDVVDVPVRVEREDDPDLAGVDHGAHAGVGRVVARERVEEGERLLQAEPLAGVVQGVDQDLRLRLVERHVVGDLGDPDVAPLVALPDREDVDEVGVGGLDGVDLGHHLGVGVVAAVAARVVRLGGRGRGGEADEQARGERERDEGRHGTATVRHAAKGARPAADAQAADGAGPTRDQGATTAAARTDVKGRRGP